MLAENAMHHSLALKRAKQATVDKPRPFTTASS